MGFVHALTLHERQSGSCPGVEQLLNILRPTGSALIGEKVVAPDKRDYRVVPIVTARAELTSVIFK